MEKEFQAAFEQLNDAQKRAVKKTEGPVLVLAGPGTGKTQLLGTRAAYIARKGVVSASNILCLTYTDVGANEMRKRLGKIMGPAGSDVAVHTFHSFGTWLINQYPEQFSQLRSLKPLDDLGGYHVLEKLLTDLPFRHPFAVRGENEQFARQGDVADGLKAFKQAGYTPDELRPILTKNEKAYQQLQPILDEIFGTTLSAKRLDTIESMVAEHIAQAEPHSYAAILLDSLASAVQASQAMGKTVPLGIWRGKHMTVKDQQKVLKSSAKSQEVRDLVDIYEKYQQYLLEAGKFDYEDMILQAVSALEGQADIRLDVAERFQYLMVDEYQDTNGAQNRLLDAILGANPLDSPNVMVVGDDDQAVMRFQGAEVAGLLRFVETYQPEIVVLEKNYRSGQPILDAARQIITQTDERLEVALPEMKLSKQLVADKDNPAATLRHNSYLSPAAEYATVTDLIAGLLGKGVPANQIAVIGRKHPELQLFIPYMAAKGIPISYDRRENVIEDSRVAQLLDLARYIHTLAEYPKRAAALLPKVLSADYWDSPALTIYEVAAEARLTKQSWLDTMLANKNLQAVAEWLIAAASASRTRNFTQNLDILLGREALANTALGTSPFAGYLQAESPENFISLVSHLIRLRTAVLEARPTAGGLEDLLEVADDYRRSGIRLIDDNPILRGNSDNVQVMSAHGAKGREFDHVIILSAIDTMWGPKARGKNSKIPLPENLPLYPAGDADSDKLRLLYVALTRARSNVLLTSYENSDSGKAAAPLPYLQLGEATDGWWQAVPQQTEAGERLAIIETSWRPQLPPSQATLRDVLEPALPGFRLSATALRDFLDIRYSGPLASIEKHLLKFPSAYNPNSALGSAAHTAMKAAHTAYAAGKPLTKAGLLKVFDEALDDSGLSLSELTAVRQHGHDFLPRFVTQFAASDFDKITETEQYLNATLPDPEIPLTGSVDAIVQRNGSLEIYDYKTGKPPLPEWQTTGLSANKQAGQHFYRQQILFYKLLLDNSKEYASGQGVTAGELIFVEPDRDSGGFIRLRIETFDPLELENTRQLIQVVYTAITNGRLPDTAAYSQDLKGILAFEKDLLEGKI